MRATQLLGTRAGVRDDGKRTWRGVVVFRTLVEGSCGELAGLKRGVVVPGLERIPGRLESEAWTEKRSLRGANWVRSWMEVPSEES